MTLSSLIPFATLGAVVGLDVVSFPQAQLSRPLVAGTLAGALGGNAMLGLVIGATLELIALETLPFGASRYPEWGSASVIGGALYAAHPDARAGAMPCAVRAAVATAWAGGWTMVQVRRLNARLARARLSGIERGSRSTVIGLQLVGMSADLLRGALLTAGALLILAPLVDTSLTLWTVESRLSRAVATGVAASVALAAGWKLFHSTPGARWYFLTGLAVGLGMLVAAQ
ncbi:MAG: hypothetical protein NVS1B4_16150 [Gemmatimonadaceae bacterium]